MGRRESEGVGGTGREGVGRMDGEEEEDDHGVRGRTPPEKRHPQWEQQDYMKNME